MDSKLVSKSLTVEAEKMQNLTINCWYVECGDDLGILLKINRILDKRFLKDGKISMLLNQPVSNFKKKKNC